MDKNILDFENIKAGWMNMVVYDNSNKKERRMRISYLQPFFDDLLMACKFLLSDIIGIYELIIDQEGFEANIRFYKYRREEIGIVINEEYFEDEIPYNGSSKDWDKWRKQEVNATKIIYSSVSSRAFIQNIITLVEKYKQEYNEGFALSSADYLDEQLLSQVKSMYNDKYLLGGDSNEKTSNT